VIHVKQSFFIITLLIIFHLSCSVSCGIDINLLNNNWQINNSYNYDDYPVLRKTGENFLILLLTDTQLEYSSYGQLDFSAISQTFSMIHADIQTYKPDLIILLGDNAAGAGFFNAIEGERLITFLDSFKIPYAPIMGNHDGEGFLWSSDDNRKEVIAKIFEKGRYSLFKRGPVNLGVGNYKINIVDEEGSLFFNLIMMDNSRDYFNHDQVEWYKWIVTGVNSKTGIIVPNMLFFHIPLPETSDLYKELSVSNPELASEYFWEPVSGENSLNYGMFEMIKEMQSTTHLFFGHDHLNILNSEYQGIRFVYGLKTGTCNYCDKDRIGTTLITLKANQDDENTIEILIEYLFH